MNRDRHHNSIQSCTDEVIPINVHEDVLFCLQGRCVLIGKNNVHTQVPLPNLKLTELFKPHTIALRKSFFGTEKGFRMSVATRLNTGLVHEVDGCTQHIHFTSLISKSWNYLSTPFPCHFMEAPWGRIEHIVRSAWMWAVFFPMQACQAFSSAR